MTTTYYGRDIEVINDYVFQNQVYSIDTYSHFTLSAARSLTATPTLPDLLRFKIPQLIGRHYSILGPLLLNDDTGAVTSAIVPQYQLKADAINQTRWLQGQGKQPVTWSTLLDVLKEVYKAFGIS